MSFNLLQLRKVSDIVQDAPIINVDSVVVGFSCKTLFELAQHADAKSFLMIDMTERSLEEHLMIADAMPYPWFSNEVNDTTIAPADFYKDGEFRSWAGRHKIHHCQNFFKLFQAGRVPLSWFTWWQQAISAEQKEQLAARQIRGQVKQLQRLGDQWEIELLDGKKIRCRQLQWNLPTEVFLKNFHFEKSYPKSFLSTCDSYRALSFILVKLTVSKASNHHHLRNNVLLPLTMAEADEGYCLLTVKQGERDAECYLLYVMEDGDTSEDIISSKIKAMKKQFKKIFQVPDTDCHEEKVWFLPHYFFEKKNEIMEETAFLQAESLFHFDDVASGALTSQMFQVMQHLTDESALQR